MKILEIQSSARQKGSISRLLSQEFLAELKESVSTIEHKQRDVGSQPPSHVDQLWTKANYFEPKERTAEMIAALSESESMIEELFWADYLLLGVPMYNLSVPSTLKAYIDNVVRINRTFSFDPQSYSFQGLLTNKKALIITPAQEILLQVLLWEQ